MTLTTAKAFEELGAKLRLTDTQKITVRSRREKTHDYLRESFGDDSDMPLVSTTVIGSAGRDTIIRPLDDIDVLAQFSNEHGAWSRYRYDSKKFLYRIRDALSSYQVKVVGARGQAVRLFYTTRPHVDIAPVFAYDAGGYALPSGDGGWLTTDPDKHAQWMSEHNAKLNYHLKPIVRLLKRWNRVHSNRLKSFHLEVLVASIFLALNSNYREATRDFFRYAGDYLAVTDPAGYSGDLSSYLTWQGRQQVLQSFSTAAGQADRALLAEAKGDHAEAMRLWRIVFGDEFPAYG